MSQDLASFVDWLRSRERRLALSDDDLLEVFWQAHPRLRFFKSLPWGANVLDIGAGNGGLAHWKGWLKPDRADLNLYGADRNPGEFGELYLGWETVDLDREVPKFHEVIFNGVFASHLIEYLAAPESLVQWLGERVEMGARVYLEWTGPSTLDLPSRDQLGQHGIEVLTSNFSDDREHEQAPDLAQMEQWLADAGFSVIASGAIDLGILGEELFARGADRDLRSMGYWSLTGSSLYMVAIKSTTAAPQQWRAAADPQPVAPPPAAPESLAAEPVDKQALVREFGIAEGFARYKQMLGLPESDRLERKQVASLYDFAKQHGAAFHEIDPSGKISTAPPPSIGESDHPAVEDRDRGIAVTCLIDASVRAGSGFIEVGDMALLDLPIEGGLCIELDRDPAAFHAEAEAVWVITSDDPIDTAELEEGFMLLRSRGEDFAQWASDSLSCYIAANASGALPPVPVLIDGSMTAEQRETVRRMPPPGTDIIELSPSAVTRIRRLWCTPRRTRAPGALSDYVCISEAIPGFARREEAWELARASFALPPNPVIVEIGAFMGSGTILLAGARKLRGSGRVHAVDPFDGSGEPFSVPVYQRMLTEAGGGSLREHFEENIRTAGLANWVEVHQSRAAEAVKTWTTPLDLICFDADQSRAGVREAYDNWAPFLKPGGIVIVHNSAMGHRPEQDGSRVLVEEEVRPPRYSDTRLVHSMTVARKAGTPVPRIFSYWDKPALTPVQQTLDDWQSHFPDFTIFGDPDVEPIIEECFPQHRELFGQIQIPTCKSDLALLLLLYRHGGLYVDCHCGVRDPEATREVLASLDRWELILYDKNRREAPRPDSEIYPLNSVLFARPRCPMIFACAKTALANLLAHRSIEREHGFRPYHIAALSGPDIFSEVLFTDPTSPVSELKPEWNGRVRFLQESESEPIQRYMHYGYRIPGMHWSERQKTDLLFAEG